MLDSLRYYLIFNSEIILDFQKSSNNIVRRIPYALHPTSPNANIFYNYFSKIIKTKKVTLTQYY